MEKETNYENHEKRIQKLERSLSVDKGVVRTVGTAGGAVLGYEALGQYARDLAEFIGGTWHGIDLASKLAKNYFGNSDAVERYVGKINNNVSEQYVRNVGEESILADASREALEAMQRGSFKIPGSDTKAVEGITGLKGKILQWTKGLGRSEEKKEEVKIQNSEQYKDNYNALAELRMAIIEKREILKAKMKEQAKKLEHTEYNISKVDEAGLKIFEDLIKEYNMGCELLRGISSLDVGEINAGKLNARYNEVASQVDKYGVKPYDASKWGDAGVMGATVLGAYLGYKVSRPIARIANFAYHLGIDIGKGAIKTGKFIAEKIKKKRINTGGNKENDGNKEDKSA